MVLRSIFKGILTVLVAIFVFATLGPMLYGLSMGTGMPQEGKPKAPVQAVVVERFNMHMQNRVADALDGVLTVEKTYWLSDHDPVAPKPNPEKFGTYDSASQMEDFLLAARVLLQGQETFFKTTTPDHERAPVLTYLDETIMSITWKQNVANIMYTFCEVKIAHPSQFRRFLTGNRYGSELRQTTSEMAQNVNAVVASSGDFYAFRPYGVCIYNGQAYRGNRYLDTCHITESGDLIFTKAGSLVGIDQVQKFARENDVRFSLAFGPILIQDGKAVKTEYYPVGEIKDDHVRASISQLGELHYLIITANHDDRLNVCLVPDNLEMYQRHLLNMGIDNAYCLDGGQTAVIVHNGQVVNAVEKGVQRPISDIFYFATAIPSSEGN